MRGPAQLPDRHRVELAAQKHGRSRVCSGKDERRAVPAEPADHLVGLEGLEEPADPGGGLGLGPGALRVPVEFATELGRITHRGPDSRASGAEVMSHPPDGPPPVPEG